MRITGITVPSGVLHDNGNLLEFVSAFTARDHNRLRNVSRLTSTEPRRGQKARYERVSAAVDWGRSCE